MAYWDDIVNAANDITSSTESAESQSRKVFGGETFWEKATSFGSSGGAGQGFRFPSEAEANKMIKRLEERRESIQQRRDRIRIAQNALVQFAGDQASLRYVKTARESLEKLEDLNDSALRYVDNYIGKIEKVKKDKQGGEADAAAAFNGTETRA